MGQNGLLSSGSQDKHGCCSTGHGQTCDHQEEEFSSASTVFSVESRGCIGRKIGNNFCFVSRKFLPVPVGLFGAFAGLEFCLDSRLFGQACFLCKASFLRQPSLFGKTCFFRQSGFLCQPSFLRQAGLFGQACFLSNTGFFCKTSLFGQTGFLGESGFFGQTSLFGQTGFLCKAGFFGQAGFFG